MPNEVAEELYRVLQQYNNERKDERVVGGEVDEGRPRAPPSMRLTAWTLPMALDDACGRLPARRRGPGRHLVACRGRGGTGCRAGSQRARRHGRMTVWLM